MSAKQFSKDIKSYAAAVSNSQQFLGWMSNKKAIRLVKKSAPKIPTFCLLESFRGPCLEAAVTVLAAAAVFSNNV